MQRVQGGTKEEFKVWIRHKIDIVLSELLRTSFGSAMCEKQGIYMTDTILQKYLFMNNRNIHLRVVVNWSRIKI